LAIAKQRWQHPTFPVEITMLLWHPPTVLGASETQIFRFPKTHGNGAL